MKKILRQTKSLARIKISFLMYHGKATTHANYMYLHFLPFNDYQDCETKQSPEELDRLKKLWESIKK